ncbi:MAG TPA: cyclic nucleotide-binding protein [Chloroflexi bacterium]|nr:cyclic nucleotide-binding protein [Chloroflexota bacterium]HHW85816.1 cyclic nucleotide-binding/CBS domain-containing protein [Chloroflexota bacterium]
MESLAFIEQIPPFDQLEPADLTLVRQALQRVECEAGVVLLTQGGAPSAYLNIVRSGAVALRTNGQTHHLLETGDMFGFPSLLSQEAPLADAVTTEPSVIYRIPETLFRTLLERPPFAQYFLRGLSDRLRTAAADQPLSEQGLGMAVKHLIAREPIFVAPDATVQEAAQLMSEANVSSVLVAADPPGIVTDRDLRRRVLAVGRGPETPVSAAMTRPLMQIDADTPVHGAMMRMLEAQIHHLALTQEGQIVGLVSSTDLLRFQSQNPLYLQRQLRALDDPAELARYSSEVNKTVEMLQRGGLAAPQIGRIVATLNDTLIARLLQQAEARLGPPPMPYAWIVFGSEGRAEQMVLTDQDNALVYAEASPTAQSYFDDLAVFVVEQLIAAGFPPCPGGYMATNWCKPLDEWLAIFAGWIDRPEPQALMEAGIFFDFRRVHGALSLEPLEQQMLAAQRNGIFLAYMARAANAFAPPLGFFNRLRSEEGYIDLKKGGIAPVVGMARALALAAGSRERSTTERLAAAVQGGVLSSEGADNLNGAFEFFLHLRLRTQLAAIHSGQMPDNRVLVKSLTTREQRLLKDAFMMVREMQDAVTSQLQGGGLR